MSLLDYLFTNIAYDIGCRKISQDAPIPTSEKPGAVSVLSANERYWYADPFGFEWNNTLYIFLEIMDMQSGKGTIGYTMFSNGKFTPVKEILSESFHLSYPNVFEYDGTIYMIPETCHANQLCLYRAVDFPEKWVPEKVLIDGINVVDTSIFQTEGKMMLLYAKEFDISADREGTLRWFAFNIENLSLHEIQMPHFADQRPGGNAIIVGKDIFRPLQDCSNCYGEKVLLYKAPEQISSEASDVLTHIITPKVFTYRSIHKYERIHTYNRTDNYEIIDFSYKRFYITKPLRRALQIIKMFCK